MDEFLNNLGNLMIPIVVWYYLGLRWIDKNEEWES